MKSALFMLPLCLWLTACNKEVAPPAKTARPALTSIVQETAIDEIHEYSAEIRARHEPMFGFRIGGKIIERRVNTGTRVKAGDVLARLDPSDADLQKSASQAQYRLALSDAKRYRELRKSGFVSQAALDAKETALKSASAEANLASNQSAYTVLRAEHDGVIESVLADSGQVVAAGQPVVKLGVMGEAEAAFEIPEDQFSAFHVGDKALVTVGDGPQLKGHLRELSAAADPASRTYAARVALDDPLSVFGMSAIVRFNRSARGAIMVPLSAVYQQGKRTAVWLVDEGNRVSLRQVEISAYRDNGAVISKGLKQGERIVVAGVHRLAEGEIIDPMGPR